MMTMIYKTEIEDIFDFKFVKVICRKPESKQSNPRLPRYKTMLGFNYKA